MSDSKLLFHLFKRYWPLWVPGVGPLRLPGLPNPLLGRTHSKGAFDSSGFAIICYNEISHVPQQSISVMRIFSYSGDCGAATQSGGLCVNLLRYRVSTAQEHIA